MEWLFGERNSSADEWMDSMDGNQSIESNESMNKTDSVFSRSITTIERSLDVTPIRSTRKSSTNADQSYGSLYDFNEDFSFDKNKSSQKYFSAKKSIQFSPISGSTPKPSKSKPIRKTQTKRKKSYKTNKSDISLWDKAIVKNPELKLWINSFNDEMKKIESSELSVTKSSPNN